MLGSRPEPALTHGVTVDEIKEILLPMYLTGPRSVNISRTVGTVF